MLLSSSPSTSSVFFFFCFNLLHLFFHICSSIPASSFSYTFAYSSSCSSISIYSSSSYSSPTFYNFFSSSSFSSYFSSPFIQLTLFLLPYPAFFIESFESRIASLQYPSLKIDRSCNLYCNNPRTAGVMFSSMKIAMG